jgi:poly-gamma-glutamate capsule biosynthesis protein CapA/YwtB (metallophosphatase superfamily)
MAKRTRPEVRPGLALCCLLSILLALQGSEFAPRWTLALAGDVMLGRGVAQALEGTWEAAFEQVQDVLLDADLLFANLESPLSIGPCYGHVTAYVPEELGNLSAAPQAVAALEAAGFDLISLANNHALDCGRAGCLETAAVLRKSGITPLQAGDPICLSQPTSICWLALDDSPGTVQGEQAAAVVSALSREGVLVAVSIHWGGEYQAEPSPRQQALARTLAEAGAGLIVGHGPHVLQRVEWIEETLVLYSLGNTLFDQPYPADVRRGAIVLAELGPGRVVSFSAMPTVSIRGQVRPASADESGSAFARLAIDTQGYASTRSP